MPTTAPRIIKDLSPPGSKPDAMYAIRNLVSRAKNAGLSPEQAAAAARSAREHEAATLYARYQQRLPRSTRSISTT